MLQAGNSRRIYRGGDKIVSVSKCQNWFCLLLKCLIIIFILNIYVSDSTFSEDFRRAVSKKLLDSSSIYPSWNLSQKCSQYFTYLPAPETVILQMNSGSNLFLLCHRAYADLMML